MSRWVRITANLSLAAYEVFENKYSEAMATKEVADYAARNPKAAEFLEDWGTPRIEGL